MIEKQLSDALGTLERHMNLAREAKDTPTEMLYAKCINKVREALFELQQNLTPADVLSVEEGTVLVL
jgi:DNA-binding ferritin-like protein